VIDVLSTDKSANKSDVPSLAESMEERGLTKENTADNRMVRTGWYHPFIVDRNWGNRMVANRMIDRSSMDDRMVDDHRMVPTIYGNQSHGPPVNNI